jgi:hypothetical protein
MQKSRWKREGREMEGDNLPEEPIESRGFRGERPV